MRPSCRARKEIAGGNGCFTAEAAEVKALYQERSRDGDGLLLRQRVQIAHQALQPFLDHMGVDLRGRDVGMAEQRLHDAQIGAVMQKMAGEGMAQHVRADQSRRQTGGRRQFLQLACEMLPRQMPALAERRKQPFRGEPFFDAGPSFFFSCFSASIAAR